MNKKTGIILLLALFVFFAACSRKHTASPHSQDTVFPRVGQWKIEGEDSKRWTGNLVINGVGGQEFVGYIDWYYSPSGEYVGKEEFRGVYDAKSRKAVMTGYNVSAPDKLALGVYQAYLAKNGKDFVSGIWGGEGTPPDFGGWEAKFQTAELMPNVREYLDRASSSFQDNKFDDAVKDASEVIKLTNGAGEEAAGAFAIRALAYLEKRDYGRAIEDFTATIRIIPDAKLYAVRGLVHIENENYDMAIEDFNTAIKMELDAGMYLERAKAYFFKKNNDQAIEDASNEIRLYPDGDNVWDAYLVRSDAHREKGNNDQAEEDFSAALNEESDHAKVYNSRAWTYAHYLKKDFDRAIADASNAIKIKPDAAAYYDTRGWAHLGKGDYNSAADDFSKALELEPDLAESKDGLEKAKAARAAAK